MTKHYLQIIWDDIEPELKGPYLTEDDRLTAARNLRKAYGRDNGLFTLDILDDGTPVLDAFSGGDLDEE